MITWGDDYWGGDSSAVSSSLSSGVVGFANPLTNDVYDTTPPTISVAIDDGADGFLNAAEASSASI